MKAAQYHGVMFMLALTAWGAADSWAISSSLLLAQGVAIINGAIAAYVMTNVLHEWGHFLGARMTAAYSPVVIEPRGFFMFRYDYDKNNDRQFLAMSLGGIIAPFVLLALILLLVPIDNPGRAALLAMTIAQTITVCTFEMPVMIRTYRGMQPKAALDQSLSAGDIDRSKVWGYTVGAVVWVLAF